jgi:hypothetical protein
MPSEVFEQFIKPQLEFEIESFPVLETLVTAPNWAEYFRNKPLRFWIDVEWTKISLPYKEALIDMKAKALARELVNAFGESGTGKPTVGASVKNSKVRFEKCAAFTKEFWKFPMPLVCLDCDGSWDLLDGHHRLAALLSLSKKMITFHSMLGLELIALNILSTRNNN